MSPLNEKDPSQFPTPSRCGGGKILFFSEDQTGEVIKTFSTKGEALAGGKLEKLLGKQGGTVRVHKQDGKFAEERTFPRFRDPRSSPG